MVTIITLKRFVQKQWKWLAIGAVILLAWLGLRACSSDPHRKQIYTICRSTNWDSLQLMGKDRNLQAFITELLDSVSIESGLRFAWMETNTATLFERLNNGVCDAVISTFRPNVINQEQYLFSTPFFELGPVLIVRQDSNATSLKDMEGKTVGIASGASLLFDATRQGIANIYNINVNSFDNMNRALEALTRDKIDGVIMDTLRAYHYVDGFYAGKLKIVTAPLTDDGLRLIALKSHSSEALITSFNETLEKLKTDGEYSALLKHWNFVDPETQYLKKL